VVHRFEGRSDGSFWRRRRPAQDCLVRISVAACYRWWMQPPFDKPAPEPVAISSHRAALQRVVRLLRDLVASLAAVGALWILHLYGRMLPTGALAVVGLALAASIAGALFWRARIRRRALLTVYLVPASALNRWLRGGLFMAIRQFAIAAVLALVLIVSVLRAVEIDVWLALVAAAVLLATLRTVTEWLLRHHVGMLLLDETAWRVSLTVVAVGLLTTLVLLALYRAYPEFSDVSLERAVWYFVDREGARSAPFETLLQIAAANEALRLWLGQQLLPLVGGRLLQLAGWILVLAEQALFALSYLLFCQGVSLGAMAIDRNNDR
jgi:hypothetical protein